MTCDRLQKRPFSVWAGDAAGSTHPGEKETQWKPATCSDAQRVKSTQDYVHIKGQKRTHLCSCVSGLLSVIFAYLCQGRNKKKKADGTVRWDLFEKTTYISGAVWWGSHNKKVLGLSHVQAWDCFCMFSLFFLGTLASSHAPKSCSIVI